LSPWWCRRYVPPKHRFLQHPHGIPSQKTALFNPSVSQPVSSRYTVSYPGSGIQYVLKVTVRVQNDVLLNGIRPVYSRKIRIFFARLLIEVLYGLRWRLHKRLSGIPLPPTHDQEHHEWQVQQFPWFAVSSAEFCEYEHLLNHYSHFRLFHVSVVFHSNSVIIRNTALSFATRCIYISVSK
jgi:hypothetical protein